MKAIVELTIEEIAWMRVYIREHLDYYKLLAGSPKVSPSNLERYKMLVALEDKLTSPSFAQDETGS